MNLYRADAKTYVVSIRKQHKPFGKVSIAAYCEMPKELSSKLASLQNRHLSANALAQYKSAEFENAKDGHSGYDLLIDNYDYEWNWLDGLIYNNLGNSNHIVSYETNGKMFKIFN